jgi:hypothetical protein
MSGPQIHSAQCALLPAIFRSRYSFVPTEFDLQILIQPRNVSSFRRKGKPEDDLLKLNIDGSVN